MNRLKNGLATLTLASSVAAQDLNYQPKLDSDGARVDYNKTQEAIGEVSNPLNIFIKNTLSSEYRASGFAMSDGPVNQSLVSISRPNVLMKDDLAEIYGWSNFDLKTGTFSEIDAGVTYSFPLLEDFLGGKLSGYGEAFIWEYPDGRFGDNDKGLIGKIVYSGPFNASIKATQLLTSNQGRLYELNVSKGFELAKMENGNTISLTPQITAGTMDNFYGFNGPAFVNYGATLGFQKGNIGLEVFLTQQEGLQDGFEDGLLGGLGFSISF